MALDLGELNAVITADNTRFVRAVSESKNKLDRLDRAASRLTVNTVLTTAAVGATNLGAALVPLAGALTALPAAGAAAAVVVGTLRLALAGVGDAIGAGLTGDTRAFTAALAELSPAAADVAGELVDTFEGLQDAVQEAFFAPVAAATQGLADTWSGPLRDGLSDVGSELGGAASQVAEFGQQTETVAVVSDLFTGVADAIDEATQGVEPLLAGVRDLIAVFVPGLDDAGASIGDAMTRWGAWMSSIADSGRALAWFEDAKGAFAELADIGGNLAGIIAGIFTAADGEGLLQTIADITASMDTWVNGVEGQSEIADVLGLIADIAADLMLILPGVAGLLAGLAGFLGSLPGPVQDIVAGLLAFVAAWKLLGITSLIRAAQVAASWIIAMGPIAWVIAGIIALVALIIVYWDEIKAVTVAVFTAVWDWLTGLWADITGAVTGAVATITGAFDDVVDFVTGLPGRIAAAATGMWDGLVDSFKSAVNWLISLWNDFELTIGGGNILGVDVPSVTLSTPNIPLLADGGTITSAGTAIVGEAGPELVHLGAGATVQPLGGNTGPVLVRLSDTDRELLAAAGGGTVTVNSSHPSDVVDELRSQLALQAV